MKIDDIVHWRSLNKKNKYVTKTGIVKHITKDQITVKSGRKTYFLDPSVIIK